MPFYRTLEERSAGGRFLVAYDPAAYTLILAQIEERKRFYGLNKNDNGVEHHRKRLERLEALADDLFKYLQYAPNGTIRFPLAKLQTRVNGIPVKSDIPILFSTIKIEERNAGGVATYHFFVAYRKEDGIEYGYLIPTVKN